MESSMIKNYTEEENTLWWKWLVINARLAASSVAARMSPGRLRRVAVREAFDSVLDFYSKERFGV
jgi:hypothetical protein